MAFDAEDFHDDVIAVAKQAEADIYVDCLHDRDDPAHWQQAVDQGATRILGAPRAAYRSILSGI